MLIICMDKETLPKLRATIRRIKKVRTNASGECIGEFIRLRVN